MRWSCARNHELFLQLPKVIEEAFHNLSERPDLTLWFGENRGCISSKLKFLVGRVQLYQDAQRWHLSYCNYKCHFTEPEGKQLILKTGMALKEMRCPCQRP